MPEQVGGQADEVDDELVAAFAALIPQLSSSSPPPGAEQLAQIVGSPDSVLYLARHEGRIVGSLTLAFYRIPTGLKAWNGNIATLVNLFTGDEEEREFDTLVLACTNHPRDGLAKDLEGSGMAVHALGDATGLQAGAEPDAVHEAVKDALAHGRFTGTYERG